MTIGARLEHGAQFRVQSAADVLLDLAAAKMGLHRKIALIDEPPPNLGDRAAFGCELKSSFNDVHAVHPHV